MIPMNNERRTMIKNVRAWILAELEKAGGSVAQSHLYEEAWKRGPVRQKAGKMRVNGMLHERITAMISEGVLERIRTPQAVIRLRTQTTS